MPLISQRAPNLLGGVSQAPDYSKGPNEFSSLENVWLDPLTGIRKRNGTQYINNLAAYAHDNAFVQVIDRSDTERYAAVITPGDLKVYDLLTGTEQVVSFPDGKGYLSYTEENNWRASTVGDHTFLVNRSRTVTRGTKKSPPVEAPTAILTFTQPAPPDSYYSVSVGGVIAAEYLVEGETRSPRFLAAVIAGRLSSYLSPEFEILPGVNYIIMRRIDGLNFDVSYVDSMGGEGIKLVKDVVRSVDDLPPNAPVGTVLQIVGQPGSGKDDTWVVAEPATEADRELGSYVVWRETTAPDTPLNLDKSTMPHALVRNGTTVDKVSVKNNPWVPPTGSAVPSVATVFGYPSDLLGDPPSDSSFDRNVSEDSDGGTTDTLGVDRVVTGTWGWSVDTTNVPSGITTRVTVSIIDSADSSRIYEETFEYSSGLSYPDQTHSHEFLCEGTYFAQIELKHGLTDTATFPLLTLQSETNSSPGFKITYGDYTRIRFGTTGQTFPDGIRFTLNLPGATSAYTLTADTTTIAVRNHYATVLAGFGGYTVVSPAVGLDGVVYLEVKKDGAALDSFSAELAFPTIWSFWSDELDLVADTLVGYTLRNLTSGATGTITSNGNQSITVSSLSGGTRTTFLAGDEVQVEGLGTSTWIFKAIPWEERKVGNVELSKWPTFLHKKIRDVFFHKGRLGFIADSSVVMSSSENLYRFFRKTVTQVLEDDPIDVQVASRGVTVLDSAVEWNTFLILSTLNGEQYTVNGTPVLGPTTVQLEHISSFQSQDYTRPFKLGQSLIFARKAGLGDSYSQVRELYEGVYGRLESSLLTERVPRYIEGDIVDIAGSADHGVMVMLTNAGSRDTMYLWQYRKGQAMETIQNAWHKWVFDYDRIVAIHCIEGELYLFAKVLLGGSNRLILEKLDLTKPPASIYADGQGRAFGPWSFTSTIGLPVIYRRNSQGEALTDGRLQLRYLYLDLLAGSVLTATVGTRNYITSKVRQIIPVMLENRQAAITFSSSSTSGFTLAGLEWEGFFHGRSNE